MRFGADETNCRSCHQLYPASDLDRYLWCPNCRATVRRRGARLGRAVGLLAGAGVALYTVLIVQPVRLRLLWAVPALLTYVLASRIVLSVVHGYYRARGSAGPGGQERK